jgi:hypothetical protein
MLLSLLTTVIVSSAANMNRLTVANILLLQ